MDRGSVPVERQKPYAKHLMPLSPSGSTGRGLQNGAAVVSPMAPGAASHPLEKALSPVGGRGGIKPLGSIDHDKHKARLAGLQNSNKPAERFRNLEPISKF